MQKSWDHTKYFLLGDIVFNEIWIIYPFKRQTFCEYEDWFDLCFLTKKKTVSSSLVVSISFRICVRLMHDTYNISNILE